MESKQKTAGSRIPAHAPKKLSRSHASEKKISSLGRKLETLRREIEESGIPLLSDKEIAKEHDARRGGAYAH
jgi:hypothetical protein